MNVTVHIDGKNDAAPSEENFRIWVHAAVHGDHLHKNASKRAELSIQLVESPEMSQLNAQFRGKEGDTNVLSFPVDPELQKRTGLLGDVVICSEVVEREAREQGKTLDHHWAHITIHGVLHLLGYDHIDDSDAEVMEALEIAKLQGLAIPNPYIA